MLIERNFKLLKFKNKVSKKGNDYQNVVLKDVLSGSEFFVYSSGIKFDDGDIGETKKMTLKIWQYNYDTSIALKDYEGYEFDGNKDKGV